MALTTLSRNDDPQSSAFAQGQLQAIIDQVSNVVMVIYGDDPQTSSIVDMAVGLATSKPLLRWVVWCPNPKVLSDEQRKKYFRKEKIAVSIGLQDKVARALDIDDAQDGFELELAYLEAEAQKPTSPTE